MSCLLSAGIQALQTTARRVTVGSPMSVQTDAQIMEGATTAQHITELYDGAIFPPDHPFPGHPAPAAPGPPDDQGQAGPGDQDQDDPGNGGGDGGEAEQRDQGAGEVYWALDGTENIFQHVPTGVLVEDEDRCILRSPRLYHSAAEARADGWTVDFEGGEKTDGDTATSSAEDGDGVIEAEKHVDALWANNTNMIEPATQAAAGSKLFHQAGVCDVLVSEDQSISDVKDLSVNKDAGDPKSCEDLEHEAASTAKKAGEYEDSHLLSSSSGNDDHELTELFSDDTAYVAKPGCLATNRSKISFSFNRRARLRRSSTPLWENVTRTPPVKANRSAEGPRCSSSLRHRSDDSGCGLTNLSISPIWTPTKVDEATMESKTVDGDVFTVQPCSSKAEDEVLAR